MVPAAVIRLSCRNGTCGVVRSATLFYVGPSECVRRRAAAIFTLDCETIGRIAIEPIIARGLLMGGAAKRPVLRLAVSLE
jgi:hypothetical protein